MAFSFTENGKWRRNSKRTALWWGCAILGAALFGTLMQLIIPVPGLGAGIGIGLGGYLGAIAHHQLCKNDLKNEFAPQSEKDVVEDAVTSTSRHTRSFGGKLWASTKALFSGRNPKKAWEKESRQQKLNDVFIAGPKEELDIVAEETSKFLGSLFGCGEGDDGAPRRKYQRAYSTDSIGSDTTERMRARYNER